MKIAILDDYQNVALKLADWSDVAQRAEITVFNDHVADPSAVVERLLPFDIVCVMRERTPLPRDIIQQLPQLKLIASTGARNASIDEAAARERGITITATSYWSTPTIELTWALILASMRHIVRENTAIHAGRRCCVASKFVLPFLLATYRPPIKPSRSRTNVVGREQKLLIIQATPPAVRRRWSWIRFRAGHAGQCPPTRPTAPLA
jgi:lactate dehydrogenase-like 2-hydroxyacid dehydrogenase